MRKQIIVAVKSAAILLTASVCMKSQSKISSGLFDVNIEALAQTEDDLRDEFGGYKCCRNYYEIYMTASARQRG